jgi:HPr kinase/phosphorylase
MAKKLRVHKLVNRMNLDVVAGEAGLNRVIQVADLHRPGMEIAGYFDYYPAERVQILGKTELTFFQTLSDEQKQERIARMISDVTPCFVISRGQDIPEELLTKAEEASVPVLRSPLTTTILASRLTNFLENELAPTTTIHGVLVDVYGVGVLITGSSGIGKSETALELVKRGHRLVADDAVEIRQTADNQLYGSAPDLIKHLLEIRGIGIINVMTLFGAGAVRNVKKISIVMALENWQQDKQYDRIGLDEEKTQIIDTEIPLLTIPVRPGRNLAVIIEVAAMNYRLKGMGYNAAQQFTSKLTAAISDELEESE